MIFLIASLYIDYRYIFIYIGILEPLQELMARLGACKTVKTHSNFILLIVLRRYFSGVEYMWCLLLMYVFIF